jgi:hypothetical protein
MLSGLLVSSALMALLAPGESMPPLKGEFLSGREATLPEAANGKIALLALGFTYDSRFSVEAWIGRYRKDFGRNPAVTAFEVPMLGGAARMGKWFINSGMRKGTPKEDYEHVLTVYGGTDPWKERMGFSAPNAAYLLLIDRAGVVRWRHGGDFDEKAYATLFAEVERLLKAQP